MSAPDPNPRGMLEPVPDSEEMLFVEDITSFYLRLIYVSTRHQLYIILYKANLFLHQTQTLIYVCTRQ